MNDVTAKPLIKPKKRVSTIWLLPLIALIIGVGMLYDSWQNRGIAIQISFATAEGLEIGKTSLKYRNVDVGHVSDIGFNEDKSSIIIDVEVDKSVESFLRQDSQFWVVRPRVGTEGISGIGTLLSGAYIEVAPGSSEQRQTDFVGLETPPLTSPNADGLHLTLTSNGGTPLYVGNPVIYRGFEVGRVESFTFDPTTRKAEYKLFVHAPYHALVTQNTHFWNVGGLTLDASAEGIDLSIASLETLISGGVEFDIPADLPIGVSVVGDAKFVLYESRESVIERRKYDYIEYAILVEDSVGGLYEGAPVEYKGIRVGTVTTPYVRFDDPRYEQLDGDRIAIIVRIEPGRLFNYQNSSLAGFEVEFEQWLLKGLSATIESANLVTGSLKVTLAYTEKPIASTDAFGRKTVIPAHRTSLSNITASIEQILATIEKLPLNQTVVSTNKTLNTADTTLASLNRSLEELQTTLQGTQPSSPLYQSLEKTLGQLQRTLHDADPLIQNISNKPSAIIFSGAQSADLEPRAKGK